MHLRSGTSSLREVEVHGDGSCTRIIAGLVGSLCSHSRQRVELAYLGDVLRCGTEGVRRGTWRPWPWVEGVHGPGLEEVSGGVLAWGRSHGGPGGGGSRASVEHGGCGGVSGQQGEWWSSEQRYDGAGSKAMQGCRRIMRCFPHVRGGGRRSRGGDVGPRQAGGRREAGVERQVDRGGSGERETAAGGTRGGEAPWRRSQREAEEAEEMVGHA